MVSDLTQVVASVFEGSLVTCEALCFAPIAGRSVISVLIVDNAVESGFRAEQVERAGQLFDVLAVADLRVLYRLDRIEVFTSFLRKCVILKDEFHDLFDAIQTLRSIVLDEQSWAAIGLRWSA